MHGNYSIGGLGKDGTYASVQDITVKNVVMNQSQNGARIKTWPVSPFCFSFIYIVDEYYYLL